MVAKHSTKKLHHYVPQAYLRGFATEKERVTAQKLPGDAEAFTTSVRNVAAQMHFHRVEGLERPDEFEDVLAGIEGDAQAVIRKLDEGRAFPLSELDRSTLAYFISLQAVRGPDTRRTSEMIQRTMVRLEIGAGGRENVKAWIQENMGFDPSPEQEEMIWTTAIRPGGPPISFTNFAHIEHMLDLAQAMLPYLMARPWALVRFSARSLITCDSPVSLIRRPDESNYLGGVGFATAWGITFPLTRKLGLLMSDPMVMIEQFEPGDPRIQLVGAEVRRGHCDREQAGTAAMEKLFNEHTASNAREYVYYHPDDLSFVPDNLPAPQLVNMSMAGADFEFDGKPWFGPGDSERFSDLL
jgi:hypothetical protein